MLENIGNAITRPQYTDWDETWVVASHQVPDMSAMMRLPWQWRIEHSAVMGVWRPNV